ncbi:MAG: hypothetical protein AB7L65_07090 [Hyphomonadaceae bacterium]
MFALAGLGLMFAAAAFLFAWAASDFGAINLFSLRVLTIPALIGAALAAAAIGPRLSRLRGPRDLIWRAAASFAAAGLAWPLSFGLALVMQGDGAGALASLWPAFAGLTLGAVAGAGGGAAAAALCFKR